MFFLHLKTQGKKYGHFQFFFRSGGKIDLKVGAWQCFEGALVEIQMLNVTVHVDFFNKLDTVLQRCGRRRLATVNT